ncbi:MAG: hypothetical protein AB7I27_10640 [Bacteriovoracaceae bacterium]
MNLTLLVENNPKIESFYNLNLYTWLGLTLQTEKEVASALKTIDQKNTQLQLIIVRAQINKQEAAKEIIAHLEKNKLKIPIIVIGPGQEVKGSFAHVPNSLELKILIQGAAKALNITPKDMMNKVVPDFYPIPIEYFKSLKRSVCPVYIKDTSAPRKFILQFDKNKDFTQAEIDGLKAQTNELFIDKMDRLDFVHNVTAELVITLKDEDLSKDEQISAANASIELLSKKLLSLGVHEETIELAKKNIETMKKNVKGNPKLSNLIARLLSNKTSYLFRHTQILTYVCLHIVKNIDWGNAEQEEKISFIAFFHDIALETDEQCMIHTTLDLKKSSLPPEQKQLVERHAQISAEYVAKFPHAPMGSDVIIKQHHGTLNGVGFSESYGNNISPAAVVFIVAEEFTRILMEGNIDEVNKDLIIKEIRGKFPTTSRFVKVIDKLQTITL